MLTRFIVASYAWLIEACLWLAVGTAAFTGYSLVVPVLDAMGIDPTSLHAWRLIGAVVLPVIVLIVLAVLIGPILILLDIRQALWLLVGRQQKDVEAHAFPHVERREPQM